MKQLNKDIGRTQQEIIETTIERLVDFKEYTIGDTLPEIAYRQGQVDVYLEIAGLPRDTVVVLPTLAAYVTRPVYSKGQDIAGVAYTQGCADLARTVLSRYQGHPWEYGRYLTPRRETKST